MIHLSDRCGQVLRQHPGDDWLQALYLVEDVLGGLHAPHCRREYPEYTVLHMTNEAINKVNICRLLPCQAQSGAPHSLGSRCMKRLVSPTGRVPVQCHSNGSSHHGRLRVPSLGSGSRLAHGNVLHGAHTRIHGLHVSGT